MKKEPVLEKVFQKVDKLGPPHLFSTHSCIFTCNLCGMEGSKKLVSVAACLTGMCFVLVLGDIKGTQFAKRNSEHQPLESAPISEVEYVDGPLAPLYDFLIQHRLHKFCKLLRDAELEQAIQDLGDSWTLFAPTDASFIFLPGGTLEELQRNPTLLRDFILYHFIVGDFPSTQIQNELMVDSVQGSPLRFNIYGQTMTVSGAEILEPDLIFEMGRIYIIDRPLYPIPSEDTLTYLQKNYKEMYKLLLDVGLADYISSGTFTILVPDDEAFDYLSIELKDALATNVTLAERILLNHILPGSVYVGGITDNMQWETVGGTLITFTIKRGLIFANGIPIVLPDIPLTNGVMHVLNRVLLPEGIEADCQCKPSSETNKSPEKVSDSFRPPIGQPQRQPYGQVPTTKRPGQPYPGSAPSPIRGQAHGTAPGIPRTPGTLGTPGIPGSPGVPGSPSISGRYPIRPQSPSTSPGSRPLNPSRSGQTVRPLPQPNQITRSPYLPESPLDDDDINSVIEIGAQPDAGQRKTEQTRTTRYPPPPPPRQRVTPRPQPGLASHTTRRNQGGAYPDSEKENYPEQEATTKVPHTTRQADSWSNRQRTPAPRYPIPQRGSHNTPTTRGPQTTRTYDWNQPRFTQPSIEQPVQGVGIDSSTLNQEQGVQTQRPGTQTTSWQQRKQVSQVTTRQPNHRNTFQTTPRQPRPPPPRVTPRPSWQRPVTSTQIPSFESNQQQPTCRRQGDRITSLTRNLPVCSESLPDGCQSPPYNPSDSRPLCSETEEQGCRNPNEPFDPLDNRPLCPSPTASEDCRQIGQPTYTGDRRPLCSPTPAPQTGCKDPSAPYNPSDRRPVCRSTNVPQTASPSRQGETPPQGCRRPNEIANPQDQRPLCPEKNEQDCRPLLERPIPGDRRPVCKISQSNQDTKPVKDVDKPPKKVEKPQHQTTQSQRGRYPTPTTRRQSWQSTTRTPQSWESTTSAPQSWQSTTRASQSWQSTTRAPQSWQSTTRVPQNWQTSRQPVGKQPQSDSRQKLPQPGSRPSQPQSETDIQPEIEAGLEPETELHPSRPQLEPPSSQPQSDRYPNHPQSDRYPPQQQPGRHTPQPQTGRYPSQPHSGTRTTQPQGGSYPSQPQPGSRPSQPQPESPISGVDPRQPQRPGSSYPSQPQRPGSSYPSQPRRPGSSYPSQQPASPDQPEIPSSQPHTGVNPSDTHTSQPQSGSYPSQQQPGGPRQPQRPGSSYPSQPQRPGSSYPPQPQRPGSSYPSQQPTRPDQSGRPPSQPHTGVHPSRPQTGSSRPSQPGRPSPGYQQRQPNYPQSQPGFTTPSSHVQTQGISQPGSTGTRPGQPLVPQGRPISGQRPQPGSPVPIPGSVNRQTTTTTRRPISVTGISTTPGEDSRRTLYEIVEDPALLIRGRPVHLTKIFELFHKAGLEDILNGPGPMTVFLPSDDAFGWLPKGAIEQLEENPELLRQVLLYHVTQSEILPSSEPESYTIPSLEGNQLLITMLNGGKLILISGAKAVAVTRASNGIFYVINQLLYPLPQTDIVTAINSRPDLSTLSSLLPLSGLENMLRGQTPYTVLAPTDTAFSQLPQSVYDELTRNTTALQEILLNHIIEGAHYGREFFGGGTYPSARGGKLKFQVVSYGYQVNEVNIKTPEIVTGSGVIHLIDQVLLEEPDLLFITNIQNSLAGEDGSISNPENDAGGLQPGQQQPPISGRRPVTDERFTAQRPGINQPHLGGLQPSVGQPSPVGRVPSQGVSGNQRTSPGQPHGAPFGSQRQPTHGQQTPGQSPASTFGGRQPSTQGAHPPAHGQQTPVQPIGSTFSGRQPSIQGIRQPNQEQQIPGQPIGSTFAGRQPSTQGVRQPIQGQQTHGQSPGSTYRGRQPSAQGVRQPIQGQFQPSRGSISQPGQQSQGHQPSGQSGHSSLGGQRTQTNTFTNQRQPGTQSTGHTASSGNQEIGPDGQPNNVADLARSMGLNKFANWVTNTGLLEKIHDGGVYTVFAPTDDAVNTLPQDIVYSIESDPEQVRPILEYHIVPQKLNLNSLTNEETASTLLKDKKIRFNVYKNAQASCQQVVTASGTPVGEALATMGSVQVIPVTQVLYQPSGNLQKIVEASPILQRLNEAIKSARLTWILSGTGPMTIFAPSDTAFDSMTEDEKKALIDNKQAFSDLLKRHIIRGTYFSNGIQEDVERKSENNKPVKLSLQEGILTVNSVPVAYSDITATNGVLHVIDQFL